MSEMEQTKKLVVDLEVRQVACVHVPQAPVGFGNMLGFYIPRK